MIKVYVFLILLYLYKMLHLYVKDIKIKILSIQIILNLNYPNIIIFFIGLVLRLNVEDLIDIMENFLIFLKPIINIMY